MTTPMTTELKVDGMTCGHCVGAVEKALKGVTGVHDVQVDLEGGKATVHGDADTGAMISAVAEEGYAAQVANG
ncbi:CopZ family metallochaperone [Deinococcus frigens]|uniref:CopZ family metallochaperone n=1 Tax=Deinococcus frigens TaxID=249403 RepID=UPI0039F0897E